MSPLSYDQDRDRVINGPRPSPLQINKHSHVLQKPSLHHHRKLPVSIYVHSPKIIHTEPCEFMALVQKLTGYMQQNDGAPNDHVVKEASTDQNSNLNKIKASSLAVADEKNDHNGNVREASSAVSPKTRNRILLDDFPLYTPNYSADRVLRYSDMVFQSPNMGNMLTLSPTFLEVMKDLARY